LRDWETPTSAKRKELKRQEDEKHIRFWPNQGLGGIVYVEEKAKAAIEPSSRGGRGRWPRDHNLTEHQRDAVHPALKWIVSFPVPVQDGKRTSTLGVLAVDGLEHEIDQTALIALVRTLLPQAAAFATLLAMTRLCRISLYVEDLHDG
jgi:hypothetical protein